MPSTNTLTFTDAIWDRDVLGSEIPVLVDFWAENCGPCRQMAPAIDAVADEYLGKVRVGKLNIEENNRTAARYAVRGIPTLLMFNRGQVVAQKVGALGQADLKRLLDSQVQSSR